MNGFGNMSGGMDPRNSGFSQQRKPGFQPIQPQFGPPSMAAGPPGSVSLPFMSFDQTTVKASSSYGPTLQSSGFFEDEPPLLEELGINTSQILRKTLAIINPLNGKADFHDDADLSGPFVLFMLFGLFQLLGGKVHFGVILGWLAVASMFIYFVFNMLLGKNKNIDLYQSMSFVGYCLLPMVVFSAISLFMPRNSVVTYIFAFISVIWSARTCTQLLVAVSPHGSEQRSLMAYPCGLVYTAFSLLVLF